MQGLLVTFFCFFAVLVLGVAALVLVLYFWSCLKHCCARQAPLCDRIMLKYNGLGLTILVLVLTFWSCFHHCVSEYVIAVN